MKTTRLIVTFTVLTIILGCVKDEVPVPNATQDPYLKGNGCDPNVINYNSRDTLNLPFPIYLPENCFQEPIMVTLYEIISKGHTNVSASCRFNDHARLDIHITGIGLVTGNLYDSYTSIYHHYNGSINSQGAQVIRDNISSTLTNLTTGATFSMLHSLHQTINSNGEVTADNVVFQPCE